MASNDIQLNAGIRSNLLLLQNVSTQLQKTQLRLSTGNKINSALEGPAQFFASKGLNQRSGDLSGLKDGIGQAISTIQAADTGITSIESLAEQARGLTTQALGSLGNDANSVALRNSLASQYNTLLRNIDKLAGDSGYQGKNLLVGSGLRLDATSSSKTTVNALAGISGAGATNVISADDYAIKVVGDGAITGATNDIANAERDRGVSNLEITGFASTTKSNFDSISIKLVGGKGKDKTFTITEGSETVTQTFTVSQSDSAKASGDVLRLSHSFASGTRISFDIDFAAIEDVADTAGVGTSTIEKNVNLQIVATNKNGEAITRDALNALGQGKVSNGENAYAFDSGTARITVDERQILLASKYSAAVSSAYGTGSGAITGVSAASASTILTDETVTVTATAASFNYTTGNFASFTVAAQGATGAAISVAAISAGTLVASFTGVGTNASATYAVNFNLSELTKIATATAAAAAETDGTLAATGVSAADLSVSTTGASFANNTVTQATISFTANATSATFQYTDQFGGTASVTVTLSTGTLLAASALTFNITGGDNSGATFTLATSAGGTVSASGGTITAQIRGDYTAPRSVKFDVRGTNAGQTATLHTQQLVDGTDANNLQVQLNETNTSNVTVVSQNVQTDGQGLKLDFAQNGWNDRADIDNAIRQLDAAKLTLRAASSALSTNLNIISTRESYTKEFSDVLIEGANKLVQADQNEEGANILTLQTKQQLGTISLSLANQAQQAILRLF